MFYILWVRTQGAGAGARGQGTGHTGCARHVGHAEHRVQGRRTMDPSTWHRVQGHRAVEAWAGLIAQPQGSVVLHWAHRVRRARRVRRVRRGTQGTQGTQRSVVLQGHHFVRKYDWNSHCNTAPNLIPALTAEL